MFTGVLPFCWCFFLYENRLPRPGDLFAEVSPTMAERRVDPEDGVACAWRPVVIFRMMRGKVKRRKKKSM